MTLRFDYLCPHCDATAHLRAGQVTVLHPSWCPRSRRLTGSSGALVTIASLRPSSDQRGRCTVCGCQVPVAAGHRHPLKTPLDDLSRYLNPRT
jgi:hypothetical protein